MPSKLNNEQLAALSRRVRLFSQTLPHPDLRMLQETVSFLVVSLETYSPRHADPRLLAIPTSRGRVAAHDPNWDGF